MKTMTMVRAARAMGAKLLQGDENIAVSSVATDSRRITPGDLFFALRGENFDGHNYAVKALEAGASGVVVEQLPPGIGPGPAALQVDNCLAALQRLARFNRDNYDVPVIGITGSSGKTTTKDMVAAVLGVKMPVLKTRGNMNNEIGLPLTLLNLGPGHRAVVVEMAMRGPGEIHELCRIARPTGAVITNIGEAHFERLGSVDNIARAKGELLEHIPPHGFALLNGESPFMAREAGRCKGRVLYYGFKEGFDLTARDIRPESGGNRFMVCHGGRRVEMLLSLPGHHSVMNALAAVGVGLQLGLTLEETARGLEQLNLTGMRLEIKEQGGVTFINDAYNANPLSTKAALQVLHETARDRRSVAVLGDMLELGQRAESGHREVGERAAATGVRVLLTVGELALEIARGALSAGMSPSQIHTCRDNQQAINFLTENLKPGDMVLIKGSRGMKMEEIVNHFISPA